MDLVLVTAAIVVLSPVLLTAYVAVAITMKRPVLYRDMRAGRDGMPFEMYKFRTMRPLRNGETIPEHDHVRITRVGSALRRSSVDELPSLLNIARGEMSFVGPRPLPIRYTQRYTDHQRRRLEVQPGLTGLAQSSGRNSLSWEDRFDLDVQYVDSHSLLLDLRIIWRTLRPVLGGSDTNTSDGSAMPEFKGIDVEQDRSD